MHSADVGVIRTFTTGTVYPCARHVASAWVQTRTSVSTGTSLGSRRISPTVVAGTFSSIKWTSNRFGSSAALPPPNSGWPRVSKRNAVSLTGAAAADATPASTPASRLKKRTVRESRMAMLPVQKIAALYR
jgi:hypothetical protein